MTRLKFRVARPTMNLRRHTPGVMNSTEAEYAELLRLRVLAGEVVRWTFESLTLKLAPECRWTADFFVQLADGTCELIDVKGGPAKDDAVVKIKVAADTWPEFAFYMEHKLPRREGGGFRRQAF